MRTFLQGLVSTLVLALVLTTGQQAAAADTYLPGFQAGKVVQVDPRLANHPKAPVNVSGLEDEVKALGSVHGLAVYVVIAEKGTEAVPMKNGKPALPFAAAKLRELEASWAGAPGFPHDNYLLIMIVRSDKDPTKYNVAASAGTKLQAVGLTGARFGQENGPLLKDFKTYMPPDLNGFVKSVVRNVNADISAYKSGQAWNTAMPYLIGGGLVLLLIGGYMVVWLVMRSKALALRTAWRPRVNSAGARYLELERGYLGMLEDQDTWRGQLGGQTLVDFDSACAGFETITDYKLATSAIYDLSEAEFNRSRYPWLGWGGFSRCVAILTVRPYTVSRKKVNLDEAAGATTGDVVEVTLTPEQLRKDLDALFVKTRDTLKEIKESFAGTAQNQQDIDVLFAAIAEREKKLTTAGLPLVPYQTRLTGLRTRRQEFSEIQRSDPRTALKQSAQVEEDATTLRDDMDKAVELQEALPTVEASIGTADGKVTTTRQKNIQYGYPRVKGESAPADASTQTFLLAGNHNPDTILDRARTAFTQCKSELTAGKVKEAYTLKDTVGKLVGEASALVDKVLADKLAVETKVPGLRTQLTGLASELTDAQGALDNLNGEFLAANFADEPGRVTVAAALVEATDDELRALKELYDQQDYSAALAKVDDLDTKAKSARTELPKVQKQLDQLIGDRDKAKKMAGECKRRSGLLKEKLDKNKDVTSKATDKCYTDLKPQVAQLNLDVSNSKADWPALLQQGTQLEASLTAADGAVEADILAKSGADTAVKGLKTKIDGAKRTVRHADTRQPARDKLSTAEREHTRLLGELEEPKNNWAQLAADAGTAQAEVTTALELAEADHIKASNLRQRKAELDALYEGYRGTRYGHGITAQLSAAYTLIGLVDEALSGRDYDGAESALTRAITACNDANTAAIRAAQRKEEELNPPAPNIDLGGLGGGGGGGTTRHTTRPVETDEPVRGNDNDGDSGGETQSRVGGGGDDI